MYPIAPMSALPASESASSPNSAAASTLYPSMNCSVYMTVGVLDSSSNSGTNSVTSGGKSSPRCDWIPCP